jgi:hypothetical protein
MKDEQWLLSKKAELLALECEMQGMVAENQNREYNGKGILYAFDEFWPLRNKIMDLSRRIELGYDD